MQKVKTYNDNWLIEKVISREIENGWKVVEMTNFKDKLIIIYEKDLRKEKLEKLKLL